MEKLKNWLKTFKPPVILSCVLTVLFGATSIFFATADMSKQLSAIIVYAVYVGAAVFMSLFVWTIVLLWKQASPINRLKEILRRNKITGKLVDDYSFRTVTFTYGSLAMNIILTLAKGVAGWFSASWWLITLSAYYLVLCIARFLLLRDSRKINHMKDGLRRELHEWKTYRNCGYLLMTMTLVLFGVVVLIMTQDSKFIYHETLILAVALWDFYCLISAIIYMIRNRKKHSPIVVAIKIISLSTSMVSILSLQTAMFASFGSGGEYQKLMNLATGTTVSLTILASGIIMLVRSTRAIKLVKQEELT